MTYSITALTFAILFGAASVIAWQVSNKNSRLRKKIKEMRKTLENYSRIADFNNERFEAIYRSCQSENPTYFVGFRGHIAIIFRRSFVDGREYNVFIKSFDDDDASFNILQAEEICDTLNS